MSSSFVSEFQFQNSMRLHFEYSLYSGKRFRDQDENSKRAGTCQYKYPLHLKGTWHRVNAQ